nr:MAG TPA_asm: hypothetical protein [Caudoviricetes sp.]
MSAPWFLLAFLNGDADLDGGDSVNELCFAQICCGINAEVCGQLLKVGFGHCFQVASAKIAGDNFAGCIRLNGGLLHLFDVGTLDHISNSDQNFQRFRIGGRLDGVAGAVLFTVHGDDAVCNVGHGVASLTNANLNGGVLRLRCGNGPACGDGAAGSGSDLVGRCVVINGSAEGDCAGSLVHGENALDVQAANGCGRNLSACNADAGSQAHDLTCLDGVAGGVGVVDGSAGLLIVCNHVHFLLAYRVGSLTPGFLTKLR